MKYVGFSITRLGISACFLFVITLSAAICCFGEDWKTKGPYGEIKNVCADMVNCANEENENCSITDRAENRAKITVEVFGKKYFYEDRVLEAPDHTIYEQLERRNINAPLSEKIKTVDKCLAAGAQWREAIRYSFPLLVNFVQKIKSETDCAATDSEIFFHPDRHPMFRITRPVNGVNVDERRLYQDIYLALRKSDKVYIDLKPQSIAPEVTVEDNAKLTKKISEFSTSFSTSSEGRKNNIRLALKKLNGTVVKPGEEFSFNKTVGPRTERNGFEVAKIIVGGEYTDGVGGGVCQVSTTLYNAALTAGMKVTSVRNHTILPSYVPASLDSMVNSSSSDLKFVNLCDTPVFIKAESNSDRAIIKFYGATLPYVIKTVSREINRTPAPQDKEITDSEHKYVSPDLPAGTRVRVSYGHSGVKSEGFLRYFSHSGALIREEKIRTDIYSQTQGIIAVAP